MIAKRPMKIGPEDNGRRMSLADFDHAEVQEGYLYELSRGVITVSDVPNVDHLALVTAMKRPLHAYDLAHPGTIYTIATGSECKMLLADFESERHPDISVYKTPPPARDAAVWAHWVPELVIEVVSPGSEERDYEEKREEYLAFGVREYWVVDATRREILVLRRAGQRWTESRVRPPRKLKTRLLPGFALGTAAVFV